MGGIEHLELGICDRKAGDVKVLNYFRCQVGEGIEKPQEEDYAEEIGKMTGLSAETPEVPETKDAPLFQIANGLLNADQLKESN